MNKNKQPAFEVCALCDERYDPNSERAAFHRHPEPQSGLPREQWLRSNLSYGRWIAETPEGKAWATRDSNTQTAPQPAHRGGDGETR